MKKIILFVFTTLLLFANTRLTAQNWINGGNNLVNPGRLGTNTFVPVIFETNNTDRGRITNNGLWGIGTTSPNTKFHINSTTGLDALRVQIAGATRLLVHSNGGVSVGSPTIPTTRGLFVFGNAGIGTATPEQKLHVVGNEILSTGYQSGFKFRNRNSTTSDDDWVWYSQDNIARFWRQGSGDLLGITTDGKVGIGSTDPSPYKFKVVHGSFGINIENSGSGDNWELYTSSSTGELRLYANGGNVGNFDPVSGAYSTTSDERLKTNIKAMPAILDKVNQLKPATYQFKTNAVQSKTNTPLSYGFVAQDVMKVFPELVTHQVDKERGLDQYTMDYSMFGVIAIKAIQELQQTKQDQQQLISSLESRIAKLEAALTTGKPAPNDVNSSDLIGVSLEQNQPNPFNQTTTFRYTIPTGATASILIHDVASGSLIKTLTAPANGQAQMNAQELKAGTYIYTLVVNGKKTASKQMVISK